MPKCDIDTPKNQYHIFNTMFSIPHATIVKFVVFTKKKSSNWRKICLQNLYFDDIFRENDEFCFKNGFNILTKFLHYDGFLKNYPFWHQKILHSILIVIHMIIVIARTRDHFINEPNAAWLTVNIVRHTWASTWLLGGSDFEGVGGI